MHNETDEKECYCYFYVDIIIFIYFCCSTAFGYLENTVPHTDTLIRARSCFPIALDVYPYYRDCRYV